MLECLGSQTSKKKVSIVSCEKPNIILRRLDGVKGVMFDLLLSNVYYVSIKKLLTAKKKKAPKDYYRNSSKRSCRPA